MTDGSPIQRAKELIADSKFSDAIALLKPALDSAGIGRRVWAGFYLAKAYRGNGQSDLALEALRVAAADIGKDGSNPDWRKIQEVSVYGLASWCVWDRDVSKVDDVGVLLDAAQRIKATCDRGKIELYGEPSPYVMASLKAARACLVAGRYDDAIAVLNQLEPNRLSHKRFELNNGEEVASEQERWFQSAAKALVETEQWAEALSVCDKALAKGLHHQVEYMIGYRKAQALSGLERPEAAIEVLSGLLRRRREWWVQCELAGNEIRVGKRREAIVRWCIAMIDAGIDEKSGRKLADLALLLKEDGRPALGELVAPVIRQIWEERSWRIKEPLASQIAALQGSSGPTAAIEDSARQVREVLWDVLDHYDPPLEGTISRILPNGTAVFIRIKDQPRDVYAKMPRRPLKVGDEITCRLVESFDFKRQENSLAAVHLRLRTARLN